MTRWPQRCKVGGLLLLVSGSLLLAAPYARAQGNALSAKASVEGTAFDDVPLTHPAYWSYAYLAEEFGVLYQLPDGAFSGRGILTRYEFAVAVCNTHVDWSSVLKALDPARPAVSLERSIRPGRRAPAAVRQFAGTLKDAPALAWYQLLIQEFSPELLLLGEKLAAMMRETSRWSENADRTAKRAGTLVP